MLKHKTDQTSLERKEGLSYQSGMGIDSVIALKIIPSFNSEFPDTESTIVLCDIETTGLQKNSSIIQIAAWTKEATFERYIIPPKPIPTEITLLTGLKVVNGEMKFQDQTVPSTPNAKSAEDFVEFLSKFEKPVILVGHNIKVFDAPRIIKWLSECNQLKKFFNSVWGISDTLALIGKGFKCKKQAYLAEKCLDAKWQEIKKAHNALIDCEILNALISHFKISQDDILNNSISFKKFYLEKDQKVELKARKETLLEFKGKVSAMMVNKMASAGKTITIK